MDKFFNKIFNKPSSKIEKEKEEELKLNLLIFDDSDDQEYAFHLDFQFNDNDDFKTKAEVASNVDEIIKKAEQEELDIIFISNPDSINENLFKGIVKMRNDVNVKKQPIVFIMTSDKNRSEVERIQKYATDIIELPPYINLEKLPSQINSVPGLLGWVDDEYGEKMTRNKISFYKEYKDKLMERSDFTADTEKELEILEEIFEKNNVKKVLDAGGGEGRIAVPLSENDYEVVNIDSSQKLIEKMNESQSEVIGTVGDLKKIPIEAESQDAVTYNWHVFCDILGNKGKEETLDEAHRVLKSGGVIVLDIPNREGGSYEKDGVYVQNPGGENIFIGYTPGEDEMKKYLENSKFQDIEIKKWETKTGFKKITFIAKKID